MKNRLFLFTILCLSGLTRAQTKKWTLKQCITHALENNISIKKSELDIENSKIDISSSKANFLPNLNAGVNHSWNTGLNTDPITNSNITTTSQNTGFGISSNITLYDGLRNVKQLNSSKLSLLSSKYQLAGIKDNIAINICLLYLQVLSNKESLKTLNTQYDLSKKEVNRTKELVDAGSKPKGDLIEIEATLTEQEKAIIDMENNILISKISLYNILVLNNFDEFDIAESTYDLPLTNITSNNPQEIYNKSLTIRNEIKLSELAIEMAENNIKISKSSYQPTLSASYNYSTNFFTSNIFSTPNFSNQISDNRGHSFGLSLNIPIFNRLQVKNSVKTSKLQLEQTKLDFEQSKFDLRDKVYQAFNDTKGALKAYEVSIKAMEARKLAFEYANEKFNLGTLDSFTFNQSKTKLLNSENDVIRSKYDYIFNLKILEFYFGVPINL